MAALRPQIRLPVDQYSDLKLCPLLVCKFVTLVCSFLLRIMIFTSVVNIDYFVTIL